MSLSPFVSPFVSPSVPPHAAHSARRPLLVARRPEVIDDLVRLASAAGVDVEVAPDLVGGRPFWSAAPLVVVDDEVLDGLPASMPRRADVVLLGADVDDASVWERAVRIGAEHVVFLPDAQEWLLERFGDAREGLRAPARVLAVAGGRGGAGASTLAAALAVTAVRRGSATLLVDLDPLGGGIDLVLGLERAAGLRWPDLLGARGRINGASLCAALPSIGELPVLAWDRGSEAEVPFEAARSVIDAAARACDVVVVDLPRGGGLAALHAAGCAEEVLVVVPAEVRAVAAAERVLRIYRPVAKKVRTVVRGPAPGGLLPDAVSEALGVELAGWLRPEARLAQAAERGEAPAERGRGPLAELARSLLDAAPAPPASRSDL